MEPEHTKEALVDLEAEIYLLERFKQGDWDDLAIDLQHHLTESAQMARAPHKKEYAEALRMGQEDIDLVIGALKYADIVEDENFYEIPYNVRKAYRDIGEAISALNLRRGANIPPKERFEDKKIGDLARTLENLRQNLATLAFVKFLVGHR